MRLITHEERVLFIVSRVTPVCVELVEVETGKMERVSIEEYEILIEEADSVGEYCPFVTPKELRFEHRQGDWVERLREDRLKAVSHLVKKARKKKASGGSKPRKKKALPKAPSGILEKILMMPEAQRPALAESLGYSL